MAKRMWCPNCRQKLFQDTDENGESRAVCYNRSCRKVYKVKKAEVTADVPVSAETLDDGRFIHTVVTVKEPELMHEWQIAAERARRMFE